MHHNKRKGTWNCGWRGKANHTTPIAPATNGYAPLTEDIKDGWDAGSENDVIQNEHNNNNNNNNNDNDNEEDNYNKDGYNEMKTTSKGLYTTKAAFNATASELADFTDHQLKEGWTIEGMEDDELGVGNEDHGT